MTWLFDQCESQQVENLQGLEQVLISVHEARMIN